MIVQEDSVFLWGKIDKPKTSLYPFLLLLEKYWLLASGLPRQFHYSSQDWPDFGEAMGGNVLPFRLPQATLHCHTHLHFVLQDTRLEILPLFEEPPSAGLAS